MKYHGRIGRRAAVRRTSARDLRPTTDPGYAVTTVTNVPDGEEQTNKQNKQKRRLNSDPVLVRSPDRKIGAIISDHGIVR